MAGVIPETRYTKSGDLSIAYQVIGNGPADLILVPGWMSNIRVSLERGKGDHRHFGARQRPYGFTSPDQLMADFTADIARWNHENGRCSRGTSDDP